MAGESDGSPPVFLKDRPLSIGGRNLTLRFAMIGQLAIKEKWGLRLDADLAARVKVVQNTDLPAMLWACLRSHHHEISMDDVLAWLDAASMTELDDTTRAISEAIAFAWSTDEKKPKARAEGPRKRS